MRIGIFGGTFDPPHNGHLALARCSVKELRLNRLYIVPAKISPHKLEGRPTSGRHRINMLQKMVRGKLQKKCWISRLELERAGPSYTMRTLAYFRKQHPRAELYFVMGSDGLKFFPQWKNPDKIIALSWLAVGRRDDAARLPRAIPRGRVHWLKAQMPKVSATAIREAFAAKRSLDRSFLPGSVQDYIDRHHLYANQK